MTKVILALMVAHLFSIAYTIMWLIDDKVPLIKANLFIDQKAVPGGIEVGWYVKYITDHLMWCITYWVFSVVAFYFSKKLFLIVTLLAIYHLIDFICFLVNFNNCWWLYWVLILTLLACVVILMLPIKEKARVVYLE